MRHEETYTLVSTRRNGQVAYKHFDDPFAALAAYTDEATWLPDGEKVELRRHTVTTLATSAKAARG